LEPSRAATGYRNIDGGNGVSLYSKSEKKKEISFWYLHFIVFIMNSGPLPKIIPISHLHIPY
jgi:hypothetical protein